MKKFSKYLMSAATVTALALSTGAFLKVYAAEAPASVVAGQPVDLTYAAEKALPSVVHIKYVQNSKTKTVEVQDDPWGGFFDPFGFFGNPGGGSRQQRVQTPKREATGSGVIISQDGYIVTNNHVVEGADELTVTLNDNREFSAKIIGTDKQTDLALIKVNAKDLPAITIANSDDLKVGEWVLAVGNPYNLNNTVTAGIVSAKSRGLGASANGIESFIQTVVAQQTITDNEYQTVRQEFIPATDGTYYFGFHCTSSADWCYQLFLDDITVVGQSQKAPDAVTDLTVTAAADGSTEATLRFTTPKKAIDGSALQAPLTITILRNGEEVGEKTNLQPATAYDYTDPDPDEGLNTYSVVAKNAEGTGRDSQPIEVYIGLDTPESPTNIQQSQDDTSITLTWSPVTTGEHGGYVNPADIIYNV